MEILENGAAQSLRQAAGTVAEGLDRLDREWAAQEILLDLFYLCQS